MAFAALKPILRDCAADYDCSAHFVRRLAATPPALTPYRHWNITDILPLHSAQEIAALPVERIAISETYGKRDSNNAARKFFDVEQQAKFPVVAAFAQNFQSPEVVRALEQSCGVNLKGSSLRVEYCQDSEGFWLEPHTDIGAKLFTMLVYLTTGENAENMGTDIYDGDHKHVARAPSPFNSGLIFIPAQDTWHGFEKRAMPQVRKLLIVNYVIPEWRSRHELCFPEQPIV